MHLQHLRLHPEKYPTRNHYPFNLPVFQAALQVNFDTPVTLFVGENGSGKSTLLEALAQACSIYHWRATEILSYENNPYAQQLSQALSLAWTGGRVPGSFFDSKNFEFFAENLEGWAVADPGQLEYFGGRSLMSQSHGQSLMSFFQARYQRRGLYLLDEPETALSPRSQLELLKIIIRTSQAGQAQFILATHSPILLACPGARLYRFDPAAITPVAYTDTDHYQIYKRFMADPAQALTQLLADPL